jgi:hypothetical protein
VRNRGARLEKHQVEFLGVDFGHGNCRRSRELPAGPGSLEHVAKIGSNDPASEIQNRTPRHQFRAASAGNLPAISCILSHSRRVFPLAIVIIVEGSRYGDRNAISGFRHDTRITIKLSMKSIICRNRPQGLNAWGTGTIKVSEHGEI